MLSEHSYLNHLKPVGGWFSVCLFVYLFGVFFSELSSRPRTVFTQSMHLKKIKNKVVNEKAYLNPISLNLFGKKNESMSFSFPTVCE